MILREPTFRIVRHAHKSYVNGAFELVEPFMFAWRAKKCVVTVPAGEITNFASIPIGFQNLFPVNGRHRLPSVAHDALYGRGGELTTKTVIDMNDRFLSLSEPVRVFYTRVEADQLFYEFMLAEKVNTTKAWLMYQAVKLFGGRCYGS